MIDGIPLDFGCGLSRRLPVTVTGLFGVARRLVFFETSLNERAVPQISRQALSIVLELLGGSVHRELSTSAR
jgi:hypothetical protein